MRSLVLTWSWVLFSYLSADGAIVVLNGLTHVHNAARGAEIYGKVRIKNDGRLPVRVLIYPQDLVPECGKSPEYVSNSGNTHSLTRWLSTNVDERTLSAGEEYDLGYTVSIPGGQNEPGKSYWQVLMVESADPVKEETVSGISVNSKVRYAIQVIVNVEGFESPPITFEKVDYKKQDKPLLDVLLKNSGRYTAMVKVLVELYNEEGVKVKKLESLSRRLYPSFCNTFQVDLHEVPPGKYAGVIIADNGKDLFGTNFSLEF